MTNFAPVLFWISLALLLYTYLFYFIIIVLASRLAARKPKVKDKATAWPEVTVVIAAFNEERFITEKINNSLTLDYPLDKLSIVVVTDGSTDSTPDLVRKFNSVKLFHEAERKGKIHAVDRIMKHIKTSVVIFTDANTTLNNTAIKNIVRHYEDITVGGVAGEKQVIWKEADNASGAGEGLYWKYESLLKKADSDLYTVVGAAGELFSIRTSLYESPPPDTIIEDFYLSMKIVAKGYRFVYEPDAYAMEGPSATTEDEWKRKVRISAGGLQAIARLTPLLNPFRYGVVTFQYVSHRVLRWTLAPLALLFVFLSNAWLIHNSFLYLTTFLLQSIFYILALSGHFLRNKKIPVKGFFVPYYFTLMNLSVFFGLLRLLKGRQSVVWEKAERA
ncbi:MAG: glycosyltransferase family 2 protein [Cyclobacteriaceae bacterium]|nr:glycosyltransferase family 2 protein [Cyclobacteriaceae bacterium]UYN85843.1 MAG: glycosyltransferase family 2 protein [Cyclobacteriaceae bacterium]